MKKFKDAIKEFVSLVQQYKFIEAVDKFYDKDIISIDNNNDPTKGMEILENRLKTSFPIHKLKSSNYFQQ